MKMILVKKIKIYICGNGLNLLKKKDESLPYKLTELNFILKENINYEIQNLSNTYFYNQSYALCKNKNNIAFNFLDNYSKINRWDINKEVDKSNNKSELVIFSNNLKKYLKIILKQKFFFIQLDLYLF